MATRTAILLTSLLTLTACQVPLGAVGQPPEAEPTPAAKQTRRPAPTPSVTAVQPDAEATGEATASASAYDLLEPPASGHVAVDGSIAIDAEFLLSTGSGKLIGHAGGNLIGHAGGNIIAAGGGNLIGHAGGNIIAAGGGNLIGHAGGNIIAAGGGNLIGKRKYGLLDEEALTLGAVLKAAEMEIRVFSMSTCQQLPLGQDASGQPVMSVYSNLTGDFRLYLPDNHQGQNVRIEATVPDSTGSRFVYNLAAPVGSGEARAIDEDTALVTAYLREAFVSRLERLFMQTSDGIDENGSSGQFDSLADIAPEALRPAIAPIADRFTTAARELGVSTKPPAERRALARQAADALLAYIDLAKVKVKGGDTAVIADMTALMTEFREAAAAKMTAHAAEAGPGHERDYFSHQSYLINANMEFEGQRYEILRPSDLAGFVLEEIFSDYSRTRYAEIDAVFESVGLPGTASRERLNRAMDGLLERIAIEMFTKPAVVDAAVGALHCEN